ncbi:MAG TPA: outer membrane lipoprotein carrier protein LolA [Bryobacteraceae bacterium]
MGYREAVALIQRNPNCLRLLGVFRLLCLVALGVSAIEAGVTANDLIRQVQDRYNKARTLAIHFEESYSIQGHPRPTEAGELVLKKQGKMRWDYARPKGKLFISDGKEVYLYTAEENRVEKVPLKDTEDMRAPLAFLLGRLDMKKEFRDFQVRPGSGGTWLNASAKNDRVPYESVDMLISPDGAVRQLKVRGRDESLLSFAFENEKLNPQLSDSLFHFTIPPGAEIVEAIKPAAEGR